MVNIAVIDLGFGDSGKGISTSYLCSLYQSSSIVIRANGGHQAGHTVHHNGFSHVFSQFGSGTLQGIPTYISKYCTIYIPSLLREYEYIKQFNPILLIDPMTMITLPIDIDYNRTLESERTDKHGSVGMGFGATIERNERHFNLYFKDLLVESVFRAKIKNIIKYCYNGICDSDTDSVMVEFINKCLEFVQNHWVEMQNYDYINSMFQHHIFESAQGILLDQHHGFFPNVTRSNTTSKNILEMSTLDEIFYVTRTYQTRHGNGFMTNEGKEIILKNAENETNKRHDYQGEFRIAPLDVDLLVYSLITDNVYSNSVMKNLIITCMDQYEIDVSNLVEILEFRTGIVFQSIYTSSGPDSKTIVKFR